MIADINELEIEEIEECFSEEDSIEEENLDLPT